MGLQLGVHWFFPVIKNTVIPRVRTAYITYIYCGLNTCEKLYGAQD